MKELLLPVTRCIGERRADRCIGEKHQGNDATLVWAQKVWNQ